MNKRLAPLPPQDEQLIRLRLAEATPGRKNIIKQGHPPHSAQFPYTLRSGEDSLALFRVAEDALAFEVYQQDMTALLAELDRLRVENAAQAGIISSLEQIASHTAKAAAQLEAERNELEVIVTKLRSEG